MNPNEEIELLLSAAEQELLENDQPDGPHRVWSNFEEDLLLMGEPRQDPPVDDPEAIIVQDGFPHKRNEPIRFPENVQLTQQSPSIDMAFTPTVNDTIPAAQQSIIPYHYGGENIPMTAPNYVPVAPVPCIIMHHPFHVQLAHLRLHQSTTVILYLSFLLINILVPPRVFVPFFSFTVYFHAYAHNLS